LLLTAHAQHVPRLEVKFCKITTWLSSIQVYYQFVCYLYQSGYYSYLINVGLGGLGEDACVD